MDSQHPSANQSSLSKIGKQLKPLVVSIFQNAFVFMFACALLGFILPILLPRIVEVMSHGLSGFLVDMQGPANDPEYWMQMTLIGAAYGAFWGALLGVFH